jgi:hypothetical protein
VSFQYDILVGFLGDILALTAYIALTNLGGKKTKMGIDLPSVRVYNKNAKTDTL